MKIGRQLRTYLVLTGLLLGIAAAAPAVAGGQGGTQPRVDAPSRPVVVRVSDESWHWRDAGLGAAAALAAGLVGLGLVLTLRTGHVPRHRSSTSTDGVKR